MRRKWSLVYIASDTCAEACRDSLVKIRDARLSQSGEARRVQYFLFYTAQPDAKEILELEEQHPRMVMLVLDAQEQKVLLNLFMLEGETSPVPAQRVYLIDPIGNLMMYYPDGFPGNGLLKDLRHLLHWSQIG